MTAEDVTAAVPDPGQTRFYRMTSGRLIGVRVKSLGLNPALPKLRVCGFWADEGGTPKMVNGEVFEAPPSEHTVMSASPTDIADFIEARRRRMAESVDLAAGNHEALAGLAGIDA